MQNSSPSKSHSSQVPIKVQHRIAKRRAFRRKRVDLNCGYSYYVSHNCHNHGFTHRGVHHCSSSNEWRVYLGGSKSPLFQDPKPPGPTILPEPRHNSNPDPVQPQPEESTGTTQMLANLPDLDEFNSSDWAFLTGL
uniref:Transcriptional activator protein n=1 Tax=Clerodendron yellow mosaic virus TaxID=326811 RepID=A0A509GK66_9GEMI|nr:transcriptional activator protein [Clerodendron yellow mosaic virus]